MSLEADDREWSGLVTWVDQATNQGAERRQKQVARRRRLRALFRGEGSNEPWGLVLDMQTRAGCEYRQEIRGIIYVANLGGSTSSSRSG